MKVPLSQVTYVTICTYVVLWLPSFDEFHQVGSLTSKHLFSYVSVDMLHKCVCRCRDVTCVMYTCVLYHLFTCVCGE